MEAYPKPRHQYVYQPRYGQRGVLSYAGQQPNGAYPTGVIPNAGIGYGYGVGVGMGVGVGLGVAAAGYHPGVYTNRPYYTSPSYYHASYVPSYCPTYTPSYSGYYSYGLYGSMYPHANYYYPYQRTYYDAAPGYGYATQAHVYPPGPTATTTTTTYHVTNSHAGPARAVHQPVPAPCAHGPTRGDIQTENRRVATERGAYSARRIKPADARNDDPFWCRERNGEWHLRSYYQIENECHPGRWLMDAEAGFLVFHRE